MAIIKEMTRQVSRGSAGDYQADEQAGARGSASIIKQMSRQVSRASVGDNQADDEAGVALLSCQLSSR